MTKPTVANESNLSLTNAPLVYADALVGLAIGPFVSKMILGVEDPGQKNVPSLQISIPTNELHNLATHIIEILQDAEAQEKIANSHKDFQVAITRAS